MSAPTFTETPPEELESLTLTVNADTVETYLSPAAQLLRSVTQRATPEAITEAAEAVQPNYGRSFLGGLVRTYGYLLAVHYRLQTEPDLPLETIRTEMAAHRDPLTEQNTRLGEAYDVLSEGTERAVLDWFGESYLLTLASHFPDRDSLVAGIRTTVDHLWPVLTKLDAELLGMTDSDGGTTP